jgi:hypothetical protein
MAKTMDARRRRAGTSIEFDLLGKGMEGAAKGGAPDGAVGLNSDFRGRCSLISSACQ